MRLHRLLIRWCPSPLRRELGDAMEETIARRLADVRDAGMRRRLRVWGRELFGLLVVAASERWGPAGRPRRARERIDAHGKAGRMDGVMIELWQAARRLVRAPGFTAASVLTLALAIGVNASIFAVVKRVVIDPLPYPSSDRLVTLRHRVPRVASPSIESMPPGLYFLYTDRARTLKSLATHRPDEQTLTGVGEPERVRISYVTPSLATVLESTPTLGRWFREDEGAPGAPRVAIVSHGLWMRRFGSDPALIGRAVGLDGTTTEIVGVMPASFAFPPRTEIWMADQITRASGFGLFTHAVVARLRDGVATSDARTELNSLIQELPQAYAQSALARSLAEEKMVSTAVTLKERMIGGVERTLWILLGAVGLVLLAACGNVANLFLVRSESRQREVQLRRALGAGSVRIARFFLAESALLSIAGGVVGLAIALVAVELLVSLGPASLPRLQEIRLDWGAVAFTFLLSTASGLIFGGMPLLHGGSLASAINETGRGNTVGRSRHLIRRALMAAQVALALVLLIASGLMARSFQQLRALDPGFNAASALTFRIGLPAASYTTRDAAVSAHRAILDRIASTPGVTGVGASSCLPLGGMCYGNSIVTEQAERADDRARAPRPVVAFRAVTDSYVETIGLRLVRGRGLETGDVERRLPNVVVNQALVDAYFADVDPIGRRIASNRPPLRPGTPGPFDWFTIVGVVGNTPTDRLTEIDPLPLLYMPMSLAGGPEIPSAALVGPNVAGMSYVIRSGASPASLASAVRSAVAAVDSGLAVADVETLQDILDRASAQMAFTIALLAIAAVVTLALGVVGIYGVMSYMVTQRTGEIGVRLALGAEPGSVAALIARQGAVSAIAGIVIGLSAALAGSRLIESLLYGVSSWDPLVFGATTVVLFAVALAACWGPARRAARLDPLEALRAE